MAEPVNTLLDVAHHKTIVFACAFARNRRQYHFLYDIAVLIFINHDFVIPSAHLFRRGSREDMLRRTALSDKDFQTEMLIIVEIHNQLFFFCCREPLGKQLCQPYKALHDGRKAVQKLRLRFHTITEIRFPQLFKRFFGFTAQVAYFFGGVFILTTVGGQTGKINGGKSQIPAFERTGKGVPHGLYTLQLCFKPFMISFKTGERGKLFCPAQQMQGKIQPIGNSLPNQREPDKAVHRLIFRKTVLRGQPVQKDIRFRAALCKGIRLQYKFPQTAVPCGGGKGFQKVKKPLAGFACIKFLKQVVQRLPLQKRDFGGVSGTGCGVDGKDMVIFADNL